MVKSKRPLLIGFISGLSSIALGVGGTIYQSLPEMAKAQSEPSQIICRNYAIDRAGTLSSAMKFNLKWLIPAGFGVGLITTVTTIAAQKPRNRFELSRKESRWLIAAHDAEKSGIDPIHLLRTPD